MRAFLFGQCSEGDDDGIRVGATETVGTAVGGDDGIWEGTGFDGISVGEGDDDGGRGGDGEY